MTALTRQRLSALQRLLGLPLAVMLVFLPLVAIVATRGDTRDTSVYVEVFQQTRDFPWNPLAFYSGPGMEWLFGIASWLFNAAGIGVVGLFFVISLATFYFLDRAARNVGLTLIQVGPYYLGSFFLLQQFMQIRQGIGAAFALWAVTALTTSRRPAWRTGIDAVVAATMHLTAVLMVIGGKVLNWTLPRPTRPRIVLWTLAIIAFTVVVARLFMSLQVIDALGRLSVYAVDEEYSASRGFLALPNIRATLLLLLMLAAAPMSLLRSRCYVVMIGLYAAHLGFRFGFFDFLILSGRLSTAVGFVEVLLLPMLVHARIASPRLRLGIGLAYLLIHVAATLTAQAPFLIDDYLTPLHIPRSPA